MSTTVAVFGREELKRLGNPKWTTSEFFDHIDMEGNPKYCPVEVPKNEDDEAQKDHKSMATRTLKEYKTIKKLGEGGFGKVYKTRHLATGQLFALKKIRRSESNDRYAKTERQILEQCKSPLIVQTYHFHRSQNHHFIMMELMEGGDMYYLMRETFFTTNHAVFYLAQLTCALEFIHSRNIVHRDIKPENILLTADGNSKLADFDTAAFLEPGKFISGYCGTVDFMAPEMKAKKEYNQAVDIYSVGVIFHEMIYGKLPGPDDENEPIDSDLNDMIKGLLWQNPEYRYDIFDIKKSPIFSQYDWKKVENLQYLAPFEKVCNDEEMIVRSDKNDDKEEAELAENEEKIPAKIRTVQLKEVPEMDDLFPEKEKAKQAKRGVAHASKREQYSRI